MRRRRWRLAAGALAGLLVVWALSTIRPREPALYPAPPGGPAVVVYLIDNGFHTDLALPRAQIAAGLKLDLRLGAGVARAPAPPASTGAAPLPTVRPLDERAGG
jgi:hypothetical protein